MFTFSEMLALVESESSFGAYVCHRRPGGSRATSDLVSFSNGNGSALYKDSAVGNLVVETCRDLVFGTMARLSDLSMPLKGEVRRSPEPSARPSAAANSEEQQICTT